MSTPVPHAAPSSPPAPVQMVQLLTGFQVSQALYVAAKLDVASCLRSGPRPAEAVAADVGADPASLGRLMRTLAMLGVFAQTASGEFALTPLGETLVPGHPGSMRDLALTWMETHYAAFARLLDGVRSGEPAATLHYGAPFFDWLSRDGERVERFTGAMANLTGGIKVDALEGYRLPAGELVADLGGADGAVLTTLLAADPDGGRRGIVFDLPHVIPAAARRLAELGLADRVEVVAGDFFASVPAADVYLLSMILHDWDDESCLRLLRAIAAAAQPGARIVALELVVPPGDAPHISKLVDLTMLGMLTGRERTATEHADLLRAAGFACDACRETATPLSIIEGTLE